MALLTQWSPFTELFDWHRDIDELFNRFFKMPLMEGGATAKTWFPPAEGYAKDDRYIVRIDVPGVDPKDVEISVINNQLTIRGERKRAENREDLKYHYGELFYGSFQRTLTLPQAIDADKINARHENGVLEVSFPLPGSLVVKKIPVKVEHRQAA
jgi:HSP20 family protein